MGQNFITNNFMMKNCYDENLVTKNCYEKNFSWKKKFMTKKFS